MITTPFKNYDEFKELFVATKENGEMRRKNGVLLSFIKSKAVREYLAKENLNVSYFNTMASLFQLCNGLIEHESYVHYKEADYSMYRIGIMSNIFYSDTYSTDGHSGICVDGDFSGYRYRNEKRDGRVFKMKIGKMYRHIMDLTALKDIIPESVKLWLCEEMTRQWEAYSASKVPTDLFLHVDNDFQSIYDSDGERECDGHFNSCMQGDDHENWKFYRDSVYAKAAYLTQGNEDDSLIVARCILFPEVTREDTGEVIRVAERQYSRCGDETLQRVLIQKLKDGGYIDAYKKTGAGCGDASAYVDLNGADMSDVTLSIKCNLEPGDHLSYQDSFKWYDNNENRAYNHYVDHYTYDLETTSDYYERGENYDEYHEEYTDADLETVYYNGRRMSCADDYLDDFRYIDYGCYSGDYVHEDDCTYCDDIGDYVENSDAHYSELLDKNYYDEEQMEEDERAEKRRMGWAYSEYDDDYCEDENELRSFIVAVNEDGTFERKTIFRESLERLVDNGFAVRGEEDSEAVYAWSVIKELAA